MRDSGEEDYYESMQIGFLTACLPNVPFEELVRWAADEGFDAIELAAWPRKTRRKRVGGQLDVASLSDDDAKRARGVLDEHGIRISAMAYYENNLHPNKEKRRGYHDHLRRVIDAAALLDVPYVGTFVGGRPVKPRLIMKEAGRLFRDLVTYGEDRGVKLMIENCPMENWAKFGLPGNYAYSPELWDALFNEVPSENFGLNYDPSHLYWLGIDYHQAARDYADRIFHAHAKDAEILQDGKYRYGVLAEQLGGDPWRSGWWRYRMPGSGEVDWPAFINTLQEIGFDGTLSIEHEDPEYEGSEDEVKEGLRLGKRHLEESFAA